MKKTLLKPESRIIKLATLCSAVVFLHACAGVDPQSVRPVPGAPEAAQIDEVSIPEDKNLPRYVLILELVRFPEHTSASVTSTTVNHKNEKRDSSAEYETKRVNFTYVTADSQRRITAQLTSALLGIGNILVVDADTVRKNGGYRPAANERGPFIVKAQITEYNEVVTESSSKLNLLTIYGSKEKSREGIVGLDVSITNPKTGQILSSFPARGTFISKDSRSSQGLIIDIAKQREFAQSVLAQATRVALNSAAERLFLELQKTASSS